MSTSRDRSRLARKASVAFAALALLGTGVHANASTSAPPIVIAAKTDTGVIDHNGDGKADYGSYGVTNAGLSVGEQGGDGWNLRYVAPFTIPDTTRQAVASGSQVKLAFTVWRMADLDGRRLVVTAIPGDLAGTADFARTGTEVFRGSPAVGRTEVDVTAAVQAATSSTITFRFATDVAPVKGDGRTSQINLATADASTAANRPTLSFTAPPPPSTTTTTVAPTTTTVAPTTTTTAPPASSPGTPAGMSLVWSDEFNGTRVNTNVWKPYHNTYGDGNKELQCLTPDNLAVSNGTLKITARRQTVTCPNGSVRQFTSGFMGTRETGTYFPRYGRFEIRAKVPHGQGMWPGFWLRHRNGAGIAEVDIMEYFHAQAPGKTTQTLHLDGRLNLSKKTSSIEAPTTQPTWQTWAVDIKRVSTGVQFTFFTNGQAVHTYVDTQHKWAELHPGQNLWDIAVNMSVGGNWVGHPDDALGHLRDLNRCAQGGTAPNNCTTTGIRRITFPTTYEVDYVRVFETK
jgi:beta-glucanase (GH16 family)